MRTLPTRLFCIGSIALGAQTRVMAQTNLDQAVRDLQAKNAELEARLDSVSSELERLQLGEASASADQHQAGLGKAASKIYRATPGLSIGGYGESLFQARAGSTDRFDALRLVTYLGYKFDENFLFNSEIEFEHGTTGTTSGTTDDGGEVSVEFAYLDWLAGESFGARAGLLLVPVGLINELHEPTAYLPADRPQTERRILPSTWRENGLGLYGERAGFAWRAYLLNGLNGEEFSEAGLRDARQSGNRAAAEDFAFSGRVDWVATPGLLLGAAVYHGDAGQDQAELPDLKTTIVDVHADWQVGSWSLRALTALATVDDAREFNTATGVALAEEMEGSYLELGYDLFRRLLPVERHQLIPYLRWEHIDTQASVPNGVQRDSEQEDEILTFGLAWKPIESIVVKLDYQDWDEDPDSLGLLFGFIF